jgi:membrane-bound lytic murein transglycosylase D
MLKHRHPCSYLIWLGLASVMLALAGCGGGHATKSDDLASFDPPSTGAFPVPSDLQDNVDFWRHVYGKWGRGQVAFHDDRYLGVIYEVADLPGPSSDGYTREQRNWLDVRKADYAARLKSLHRRVSEGKPLSPDERELMAKFDKVGGRAALAGAEERVRSQRGLRERFRRGVEISGRYDTAFREIMRQHGVPEDLAYLPHVESSFQTHARSKVGAGGVWQFMPGTARNYMTLNGAVDERFDPILAADGAARYLAQAYRKLGSWPLAITSYNHGQGGMAKAKAIYGDDIGKIATRYDGRAFGFASRNFYAEFVAAREVASNPERYFPEGVRYESPWHYDRLVLHHPLPADSIARHYGVSSSALSQINLHWDDRVRTGSLYLPAGTTIWLPEGSTRRVASHPPPMRTAVYVAENEPKVKRTPAAAPKQRVAQRAPKPKVTAARYHVVKADETLYRVALKNGISVDQLRKLNKMGPGDTKIRPGQRLKVGI